MGFGSAKGWSGPVAAGAATGSAVAVRSDMNMTRSALGRSASSHPPSMYVAPPPMAPPAPTPPSTRPTCCSSSPPAPVGPATCALMVLVLAAVSMTKSRVTPRLAAWFGLVSKRAFCAGDASAGKLSATAGYGPIQRSGAESAIGPASSMAGGGGGGSGSAARLAARIVSASISSASASRDARSASSAKRSASACRLLPSSAEQAGEGVRQALTACTVRL